MKKILFVFAAFYLIYSAASAQTILENQYTISVRKFVSGNLSDKLSVLAEAERMQIDSHIYVIALEFISKYYSLIADDPTARPLALAAVSGLKNTTAVKAVPLLKTIFTDCEDQDVRIAVILRFSVLAPDNAEIVAMIENFLANELAKGREKLSAPLVSASIQTLSRSSMPSSFPVFFTALEMNISPEINSAAEKALFKVHDGYKDTIISIITNDIPSRKLLAFNLIEKNPNNSDFFRAEIAEKALYSSIQYSGNIKDIPSELVKLQLSSVQVLKQISWTRASLLVVRFFETARKEYSAGLITTEQMIEIIHSLTKLASVETGQALSEYLDVLNKEAELTGQYSSELLLAVIDALGILGEKSAFDHLLYAISFSSYPENIITAARNSLARLKW